jgi:predicted dehydrogenase
LLRNFLSASDCSVEYLVDIDQEALVHINKSYPLIKTSVSYHSVLDNNDLDAIIIATPSSTHYSIAKDALLARKHVLIEKPMALSFSHAEELMNIANSMNLIISVDHTYLYTPAVQKLKNLIQNKEIGAVKFFDSTRINLGIFQTDVNVLWDLAVHDISILKYLFDDQPISVRAVGVCHTYNNIENIAYITINYRGDFIAHLNCSWSSPVKIRMMLIGGENKTILFNDLDPVEKIKIYNASYKSVTDKERDKFLVDYRTGDVYAPKIDNTEALQILCNEFVDCIKNNKQPISNANFSLGVIKILEAAQTSIKSNGQVVYL